MEIKAGLNLNTAKYEASSEDFSNAFYNNQIKLVTIGTDPDEPRYELRDTRNPKIYPVVSLPGDD